jgi:hypothetical protein
MELHALKNVTVKRSSSIGKLLTAQSAPSDSIQTSRTRGASYALIRTVRIVSSREINSGCSAKKNALLARKISGLILKCACAGLNAIQQLFSIFIPKVVSPSNLVITRTHQTILLGPARLAVSLVSFLQTLKSQSAKLVSQSLSLMNLIIPNAAKIAHQVNT